MLGRAFEDLLQGCVKGAGATAEELAFMTDQEFMQFALECGGASTTAFKMVEMLMRGNTFDQVNELPIAVRLEDPNKLDPSAFRELPSRIQIWAKAAMRADYASAYIITPEDWARDLAHLSEVEQSQVMVSVPSWSIVDKWAKEGEIRLLMENDGRYSVSYVKDVPNTIWKQFVIALARARLKIRVFVDPELSREQKARVREQSLSYFNE
jgi:hypothetical protein